MTLDLCAAASAVATGQLTAQDALRQAQAAAALPANRHTFIRRFEAQAEAAAAAVDALRAAGGPVPPLAGLAVSVKDLFNMAGAATTAGSLVLADTAPARQDSAMVARLRAAGAALVGHTNMTEFAFSGVGINPHHGTPANPVTAPLDPLARVPGGSSSGAAVSVATGAAWAALGSDTGGSIRIPAALQGLVGFKNTQALTSNEGCLPLSPTLDTSCAITLTVRDAVRLHEVLAARTVRLVNRPLSATRLGVPQGSLLEALEPTVAAAFERTLRRLRDQGAQLVDLPLPSLEELTRLQANGGFAAAESWAWHRERLLRDGHRYDPRVATRIRRGEAISAADYLDLHAARRAWIAEAGRAMAGFHAMLSPTVPMVAPPLQPLLDSDDHFFRTNALLLRNPSVVNLLDGCALSLPCHAEGELPVGLMVWHAGHHDDEVLSSALAIEAALEEA
ncbi:amidase [Ideonella sp. BN130291]|uniref:amidase n=1 Tax=Ideonella sp. BN130291 TaxID=3112940 RepID=UPI002E26B575|nr:amidase [Ideonella sp. BN130291]